MSDRIDSRRRLRSAMAGFVVAAFAALIVAPGASADEIIVSNPLAIFTSDQLACQLYYNETHQFDTGDEQDNYCGTFVAFDPDNVWGDPTADENAINAYEPVTQDFSGSGSPSDPYQLTTVVRVTEQPVLTDLQLAAAGDAILTITQVETYVGDTETNDGNDYFRTDVTVHNDTNSTQSFGLYHVGDCAINGVDEGYAIDDTAQSGALFCSPGILFSDELVAASTVEPKGDAGILGFVPISGGSHYLEDITGEGNGDLFNHVNGSQLPDLCENCDLDPDDEDSPVDNGVALNWQLSLPANGQETRCFLTVNSFENEVPDVPSGCTPGAAPPDTIAQKPPSSCKLRISRARIFLFSRHPRMRLVARYRSSAPADVNIDYVAVQNGHKVPLGEVVKHFGKHGLFRLRKELTESQAESLRSTDRFIVHFKIPGEPGFCARQYTKHLTVPRIVEGQRVVFQEDSKFPQPGAGHPEG